MANSCECVCVWFFLKDCMPDQTMFLVSIPYLSCNYTFRQKPLVCEVDFFLGHSFIICSVFTVIKYRRKRKGSTQSLFLLEIFPMWRRKGRNYSAPAPHTTFLLREKHQLTPSQAPYLLRRINGQYFLLHYASFLSLKKKHQLINYSSNFF